MQPGCAPSGGRRLALARQALCCGTTMFYAWSNHPRGQLSSGTWTGKIAVQLSACIRCFLCRFVSRAAAALQCACVPDHVMPGGLEAALRPDSTLPSHCSLKRPVMPLLPAAHSHSLARWTVMPRKLWALAVPWPCPPTCTGRRCANCRCGAPVHSSQLKHTGRQCPQPSVQLLPAVTHATPVLHAVACKCLLAQLLDAWRCCVKTWRVQAG